MASYLPMFPGESLSLSLSFSLSLTHTHTHTHTHGKVNRQALLFFPPRRELSGKSHWQVDCILPRWDSAESELARNSTTLQNSDWKEEPWRRSAKWKKPDTKGQILYDATFRRTLEQLNSQRQSRGRQSCGQGRMGSKGQSGFCKMRKFWRWMVLMVNTTVWVCLIPQNCTLENGLHQKKKKGLHCKFHVKFWTVNVTLFYDDFLFNPGPD